MGYSASDNKISVIFKQGVIMLILTLKLTPKFIEENGSKFVTVIDYPRDMNHLNNFLFLPILDLEIRSFNMLCAVGRMMSIDKIYA